MLTNIYVCECEFVTVSVSVCMKKGGGRRSVCVFVCVCMFASYFLSLFPCFVLVQKSKTQKHCYKISICTYSDMWCYYLILKKNKKKIIKNIKAHVISTPCKMFKNMSKLIKNLFRYLMYSVYSSTNTHTHTHTHTHKHTQSKIC